MTFAFRVPIVSRILPLCYRREALESAISEKDAHLALLEMSGIRSAKQADEVDRLRKDRRRLVDRLKKEVRQFNSMFVVIVYFLKSSILYKLTD